MAKPYTISIVNGEGSANILNGEYSVSTNVTGYDNSTIDPTSVTIVEGTNSYDFAVGATGTLTIHVSDNGTASGISIVGATFIRCDSLGNTYGTEITSDSSGNAVFANVPFDSTNAPLIYYKQLSSDGEHDFDDTLKNTSLSTQTGTVEVLNPSPALRTINYTDLNYDGLKIDSGSITLS